MSFEVQEAGLPHRLASESALTWLKHVGLRWVMVFFVLYACLNYTLGGFISTLPGLSFLAPLASAQNAFWNALIPWVGDHVVGHPIHTVVNEGERLFEYTEDFLIVFWALIAAIVWTLVDRDRERESSFYEFTRVLVRILLAVVLWQYGFPKLFPCGFFPCLEPAFLMQPFGDMPARAFMFLFFGYSSLYSFLIGMAEISGAALVLFRRTTTLGALILVAVLANVFVMDVIYNVDVRRFSFTLALMAIFLLVPDALRILRAILGYGVAPVSPAERAGQTKAWRIGSVLAKVAIIGWALLVYIPLSMPLMKALGSTHSVPMGGYYQVDAILQHDAKTTAPQPDASAWNLLAINATPRVVVGAHGVQVLGMYDVLHVRTGASVVRNYLLQVNRVDSTHGSFTLTRCGDLDYRCVLIVQGAASPTVISKVHAKPTVLQYVLTPSSLQLTGNIDGRDVSLQLHHLAQSPFQLERSEGSGINLIDPDDYLWTT